MPGNCSIESSFGGFPLGKRVPRACRLLTTLQWWNSVLETYVLEPETQCLFRLSVSCGKYTKKNPTRQHFHLYNCMPYTIN